MARHLAFGALRPWASVCYSRPRVGTLLFACRNAGHCAGVQILLQTCLRRFVYLLDCVRACSRDCGRITTTARTDGLALLGRGRIFKSFAVLKLLSTRQFSSDWILSEGDKRDRKGNMPGTCLAQTCVSRTASDAAEATWPRSQRLGLGRGGLTKPFGR